MTWFWFVMLGIIGLAKRDVISAWVKTWQDKSLKNTATVGLILFSIMGLILVGSNEEGMWFWHLAGGTGGVLGLFAVTEIMRRASTQQGARIRSRRDAVNERLREQMHAGESTLEESDRARALTEEATGQRIIAGQPPVVEAAPGPQDAEDRLLSILKQMAEESEQDHQDEVLSAREEHQAGVESMKEERAIRARGMKVNLGTTGIYGRPQGSEWQGFEPENAADYGIEDDPGNDEAAGGPEPVDEPGEVVAEATPARAEPAPEMIEESEPLPEPTAVPVTEEITEPEPELKPELEPDPAPEPDPEPEPEPVPAAVDKKPLSAGPAWEGYTPGPSRLGGSPGRQAAGPAILGPSKLAKSGPVSITPGFAYQPKLVDSKLSPVEKPISRFKDATPGG